MPYTVTFSVPRYQTAQAAESVFQDCEIPFWKDQVAPDPLNYIIDRADNSKSH